LPRISVQADRKDTTMSFDIIEWLNIALRWAHVFAGILWIGSTYYFTWLDGQLTAASDGKVWMVHSGGFYVVEKQAKPEILPKKLHWFRWEAAFTWLSGAALLVVVYYMGGGMMVDDTVSQISATAAIGIGVGLLAAGWLIYDLLMLSPLGKQQVAAAVLCYALIVAVAYGTTHIMSGRAAYIHVGAMLGTIMTANVWVRILPAQRRMIAAMNEGKAPDAALAARSKLRSKHNTFMVVPVVFIMISNHFPSSTYGSKYNWIVLSALVLVGWIAAKFIRRA
jgi:uncharacterized membrane protein